MTGYKFAQLMNAKLREAGLKEIPAQMIYNYISKNYIKTTTVAGKKVVSQEEFDRFVSKYIDKKTNVEV
jgi:hypothetical protein